MTGGGEGGAFEPPNEPPPGPSKRARVDDDATPRHLRAVEFYCGVGGLHYSLLRARPDAKVVAAFDINPNGNDVYEHNFGVRPSQKNIYGLPVASFDKLDAGLWLLSPPCQPFTRQGHRKDKDDGRSQSFLRLLRDVVPELDKPPTHVLVENVVGFETSETRADAIAVFHRLGYDTREFMLTPRMFGVPYSRPRYFLLAKKSAAAGGGGWSDGDWGEWLASHSCGADGPIRAPPPSRLSGHREWVPRGASCVLPAEFEGDTKAEFDARHRARREGDGVTPKPNPADNPLYGYPVALVGAFLDAGAKVVVAPSWEEEVLGVAPRREGDEGSEGAEGRGEEEKGARCEKVGVGGVGGVAPGAALGDFFGAFYHALYVVGADAVAALGAAVLVQPRCGHFRCHMRIDGEILVLKAGEDDLLPDE